MKTILVKQKIEENRTNKIKYVMKEKQIKEKKFNNDLNFNVGVGNNNKDLNEFIRKEGEQTEK